MDNLVCNLLLLKVKIEKEIQLRETEQNHEVYDYQHGISKNQEGL